MPDRFVESHIRKLPLFANLPPQHVQWAMDAFRVLRVETGEFIFQQGERTRGMYMFVSGSAELIQVNAQGQAYQLGIIGPNQYLNEAALFQEAVESASLRALQQSTVLFVSRQLLWRVISYHPEMKSYIPIPVEAQRMQRQERVFNRQRDSEEVLLDTRRHWWAWVRKSLLLWLVAAVVLILLTALPSAGVTLALAGIIIVLVGAITIYNMLEWRNDHIIVTDQRLVHIERVIHQFKTVINEVPLSSIHQVNADLVTTDPFSRLFNYGRVDVRTAGDAGNMLLNLIPNPDNVQDLIFDNRNRYQEQREAENRNAIRAELDRVLQGEQPANMSSDTSAQVEPEETFGSPFRTSFTRSDGAKVYRKHITFWIGHIAWPTLWLVGWAIATLFVLPSALNGLGLLIGTVMIVIGMIWFYLADWDWRNDIYIVGDEFITIIHQRPLWLQNEDDQILLESVDNVRSERTGFIRAVFDYGDVVISLIGGDRGDEKIFRAVPGPQEVQAEITRRRSRAQSREAREAERRRREEIAEYLSVYHETVNTGMDPNDIDPSVSPLIPQQQASPPPKQTPRGMRPPNVPRRR